jgi:hypothetical protein
LLGFFPLYEQNTDTQNFINTQNTTLFIQTDDSADLLRATEAEIIVENEDKKKKTEIQENNNFQKIEI